MDVILNDITSAATDEMTYAVVDLGNCNKWRSAHELVEQTCEAIYLVHS